MYSLCGIPTTVPTRLPVPPTSTSYMAWGRAIVSSALRTAHDARTSTERSGAGRSGVLYTHDRVKGPMADPKRVGKTLLIV